MIFSEKYKICSSFNETAPIIQCICKVCINELVKKKPVLIESCMGEKIDPYNHFKEIPLSNFTKATVGKPDIKNPSSFKTIFEIMQALGERAKIDR